MSRAVYTALFFMIILSDDPCFAQDYRTQYPGFLLHSYFGVHIGYIDYNFTRKQLEPGNTTTSVHIPHMAVEVDFGHHFNKYLSAQVSYLRPVAFVEYKHVNGRDIDYEVGMNVLSFTLMPTVPLSDEVMINVQAGMSIVTRGGFIVINEPAVKDALYAALTMGAGLQYKVNKTWQLALTGLWSQGNDKLKQPATAFYSAAFSYTMQPLSPDMVMRNASGKAIFPAQIFQLGYSSNVAGYTVNKFVSKDAHIFWGGGAQVKQGLSVNYQRNIFHTKKVFALDVGAGFAYYKSRDLNENIVTLSAYPVFRFYFLRSNDADFYFDYSFAGPSFISRPTIDNKQTGERFTFQDFMGAGVFAGEKRHFNSEIRIAHYSNGNIFPQNNGVMIPLTLSVGYSF